jgi:hypothetical protein
VTQEGLQGKCGLVFCCLVNLLSFVNATRKAEINTHIKEIESRVTGFSPDSIQAPHIVRIHVLIAEEQAESTERLERQTETLISLTRWLFRLTWAVVALTAGLLVLTYLLLGHGK